MVFSDNWMPGSGVFSSRNVALLRPAEQFFDEMLNGWSAQQTSRMLAAQTIKTRTSQVRRFADFCGTSPWEWSPADVEEWTTSLVSGARPLSVSTVRAYQNSVALFCDYLIDHRYGWVDRCMGLFGTHPVQVCHEWNTVIHASDHEARPGVRPLSREYVTHLIEDGFDPLFVQQQVGHRWGSTTALYTGVSGDYRNRTLRRALDGVFTPPRDWEED